MRKFYLVAMVALAFGCSKPEGYRIEVGLNGASGKVFLEQRQDRNFVARDTAEIVDGVAVLEGKVEFPDVYFLSVEGVPQKGFLFVENVKMKITGNVDSMRFIRISGSPVNDEYFAIKTELDKDNDAGMAKYQEYQKAIQEGDTVNAPKLMEEVKAVFDNQEKKIISFVKDNPASWVTPLFLPQLQQSLEVNELDSLMNSLDPKLMVVPSMIKLKEQVEKSKKVAIGQVAPDFTQADPEGNPVKLSDIYAKNAYTLIDFWAAWCGPCRQENPNVVAVYNEFKEKGFGVFGVSLDQDRERWLKAVEDDKLTWPHVSDLKYWQNEAAQLYGINSIPANFLVDREGKIVARNLREKALRDKVAELLP
jgi:peroxiredoxin